MTLRKSGTAPPREKDIAEILDQRRLQKHRSNSTIDIPPVDSQPKGGHNVRSLS
jgi:hypothetical protein